MKITRLFYLMKGTRKSERKTPTDQAILSQEPRGATAFFNPALIFTLFSAYSLVDQARNCLKHR